MKLFQFEVESVLKHFINVPMLIPLLKLIFIALLNLSECNSDIVTQDIMGTSAFLEGKFLARDHYFFKCKISHQLLF